MSTPAIPPPTAALVDAKTGKITRPWYDYFSSIGVSVGAVFPNSDWYLGAEPPPLILSDPAWAATTLRVAIQPTAITADGGSKVRVTVVSGDGGAKLLSAYIGVRNPSGTAYSFTTTPTPLLFSGSASVTMTANQTLVSDETTFTIGDTDTIVLSAAFDPVGTTELGVGDHPYSVPGWFSYYIGGDDAATVAATGYTSYGDFSTFFSKLEIYSGGVDVEEGVTDNLMNDVATLKSQFTDESAFLPYAVASATSVAGPYDGVPFHHRCTVVRGHLLVLRSTADQNSNFLPLLFVRDDYRAGVADDGIYEGEGSPKMYVRGGVIIQDKDDTSELGLRRFNTSSGGTPIPLSTDESIARIYWEAYKDRTPNQFYGRAVQIGVTHLQHASSSTGANGGYMVIEAAPRNGAGLVPAVSVIAPSLTADDSTPLELRVWESGNLVPRRVKQAPSTGIPAGARYLYTDGTNPSP